MGAGIPAVCSPVGVNTEIVQHGVNGFLPASVDAWYDCLARPVEDAAERQAFGAAARHTIEMRYSVAVQAPRFHSVLERTVAGATEAVPWPLPTPPP